VIFSNAQRSQRAVYYVYVNIWLLARTQRPCFRSVLITYTVRVTKLHPVYISFLKIYLVQRIIEAQSVCSS